MVNTTLPKTRVHADQVERDEEPRGLVDRILGSRQKAPEGQPNLLRPQETKPQGYANKEVSVFDSRSYHESEKVPQQIEELKDTIKRELQVLQQANKSFSAEISHIQKHASSTRSKEAGTYHVKFLETIVSMIKLLHVKVNEADSWLKAFHGKNAKRAAMEDVHKNTTKVQYESSGMNQGL